MLTSLLRPDVRRSASEECFELLGRTARNSIFTIRLIM